MSNFRGHNWVEMCQAYYSEDDRVYAHVVGQRLAGMFWYDILPSLLFYQLADRYPDVGDTRRHFLSVADQWHDACVAMGGNTDPLILPNFDHTGFRFDGMTPVDNGQWCEPEGAAGIAWLEYMAYVRTGEARYLQAADWCIRALQERPLESNPLYEMLLPYGAVTAARMNAESGRNYNLPKLVNWCFEGKHARSWRPTWGVVTRNFGDYDAHGLVGDVNGWGFAMETFQYAGALAPLVRYDTRFAHDIGKWLLNLANASRLYYPPFLPPDHQDCSEWASRYDPDGVIGYETVASSWQAQARRHNPYGETFRRVHGTAKQNVQAWTLETEPVEGLQRLDHLWRFNLMKAKQHVLQITVRCETTKGDPGSVQLLWANSSDGPFTECCQVLAGDPPVKRDVVLVARTGAPI